MTTLSSKVKRLQVSLLQPLEQLRGDVVYHLTALELQIKPWVQDINQNLKLLKTAQAYFSNESVSICRLESDKFRSR